MWQIQRNEPAVVLAITVIAFQNSCQTVALLGQKHKCVNGQGPDPNPTGKDSQIL